MSAPLATHDHAPGALDAALAFLKRTRAELRKVRVWKDRFGGPHAFRAVWAPGAV